MKYLLDTNICIYVINRRPESVASRFASLKIGDVGISSVTLYELAYGAHKSRHADKNLAALRRFVLPLDVLDFGEADAYMCGRIRACLEKEGRVIGAMDLQIAATALANDLVLVSNNLKEFDRIDGLTTENWADAA